MRTFTSILTGALLCLSGVVLYGQDAADAGRTGIWVCSWIEPEVVPQVLGPNVNSQYKESGPMLTKDGKRLYFSRSGHPGNIGGSEDQDIWYSDFDEAAQNWIEAVNVGQPLNNAGPNFICGVGWKGDTVLLGNVYGKKGKMSSGISLSIKTGELWSFPAPVYVSNDYNLAPQVSYDLSHDRNSLVIAEQKADSYGNLDLYVAFRDPDARKAYSGTESINLGPVINSTGNELSPFLSYDGRTLFFASDGHPGYGRLDIFVSKRLDNTWTNWSKPENLGPGINSVMDDSYFGFTPQNRYAFFSQGLTSGNSDIYRVDMTYLFKPNTTPLDKLSPDENPLQIGQTKVLIKVFNDNKPEINKEAIQELESIAKFMTIYKNMIVQISTHANKHDSRNESRVLSLDRANKIMAFMVSKGIEPSRLNVNGYGHDVVVNSSTVTTPGRRPAEIANSVEFRYTGITK